MTGWIDLTRPVDADVEVFSDDGYSDPSFNAKLWSTVEQQGFEVWRLKMCTQTGTHIDAPSHFVERGATIDKMPAWYFHGRFHRVRPEQIGDLDQLDLRESSALLIDARADKLLSEAQIKAVAAVDVGLVILVGNVEVCTDDGFAFHRAVANSGKFLVEDALDFNGLIPSHGEYLVAPLGFVGLSGSPTRLLIRSLE